MLDGKGNNLEVGDKVVWINWAVKRVRFTHIVSFTSKMAYVQNPFYPGDDSHCFLVTPKNLYKVPS